MRTARTTFRLLLLTFAAFALAMAPAVAQDEGEGAGLDCPDQAEAGSTIECTATGLQANSAFQWVAEFTDGSSEEGEGTADMTGTGTFTVEVPDTTPIGGFQVTVTGTDAEGADYEETHRGLIAPGGGGDGEEGGGEDDGADSPPGEEEQDGTDDGGQSFGGGDDQVSHAPAGSVAAGIGAESPVRALELPALLLAGLVLVGSVHALRREAAVHVRER